MSKHSLLTIEIRSLNPIIGKILSTKLSANCIIKKKRPDIFSLLKIGQLDWFPALNTISIGDDGVKNYEGHKNMKERFFLNVAPSLNGPECDRTRWGSGTRNEADEAKNFSTKGWWKLNAKWEGSSDAIHFRKVSKRIWLESPAVVCWCHVGEPDSSKVMRALTSSEEICAKKGPTGLYTL